MTTTTKKKRAPKTAKFEHRIYDTDDPAKLRTMILMLWGFLRERMKPSECAMVGSRASRILNDKWKNVSR